LYIQIRHQRHILTNMHFLSDSICWLKRVKPYDNSVTTNIHNPNLQWNDPFFFISYDSSATTANSKRKLPVFHGNVLDTVIFFSRSCNKHLNFQNNVTVQHHNAAAVTTIMCSSINESKLLFFPLLAIN
jgi:hypothetical protein